MAALRMQKMLYSMRTTRRTRASSMKVSVVSFPSLWEGKKSFSKPDAIRSDALFFLFCFLFFSLITATRSNRWCRACRSIGAPSSSSSLVQSASSTRWRRFILDQVGVPYPNTRCEKCPVGRAARLALPFRALPRSSHLRSVLQYRRGENPRTELLPR